MKKEDFHKGQTVYVLRQNRNCSDLIQEWEVSSIGRKYIKAKNKNGWDEAKFEIDNDFRQHTNLAEQYKLFCRKEDLEKYNWRNKTVDYVRNELRWNQKLVHSLSDDDLKVVSDIFKRYADHK